MRKLSLALWTAALGLGACLPASGALNAYMRLTLNGTAAAQQDGAILVVSALDGPMPMDARKLLAPPGTTRSSTATKPHHKPFSLSKRLDKSSPLLQKLNREKTRIPVATLYLFRPMAKDNVEIYYKITLKNATVTKLERTTGNVAMEKITLGYEGMQMEKMSLVQSKDLWLKGMSGN